MGVEVELMAPPGKSRMDLARAIARSYGAELERFFYPQSEPSLVLGSPVFHNLTLGFRITHREGGWIASCVDDLTLHSDLNREAAPEQGWYRVLSDDERLLRLVANQCRAHESGDQVLTPLANLFGTAAETGPDGMVRVNDSQGATIAIVAPLPGERERACELVTAPLESHHQQQLDRLLGTARSLGFPQAAVNAARNHLVQLGAQIQNQFPTQLAGMTATRLDYSMPGRGRFGQMIICVTGTNQSFVVGAESGNLNGSPIGSDLKTMFQTFLINAH